MTRKWLRWPALAGVLVLMASSGGQADSPRRLHLEGVIADATLPSNGAWVIRGTWSLDANETPQGAISEADFSAAVTMERSDYFLTANPGLDPNLLSTRNAHTHHVKLVGGTVSAITGGFEVTGPADVTLNGGSPPFPTSSVIHVDITGGTIVPLSNIKLTFESPASGHFGTAPIAGVVGSGQPDAAGDRQDN